MIGPPHRSRLLRPLMVVALWLLVAGLATPLVAALSTVARPEQAAMLPRGAESTRVAELIEAVSPTSASLPLIVVWTVTRPAPDDAGEGSLRPRAVRAMASLAGRGYLVGPPGPLLVSPDGASVASVLQVRTAGAAGPAATALADVRRAADEVRGADVELAGPAAVRTDLDTVFDGVDGPLLLVALVAVALILVLVYRSPLLPLLVIVASLVALAVACACLYGLARVGLLVIDGQVEGILFVLVIGATTDYGLLLTARYREELARGLTVREALRQAVHRSVSPLAASAATVALGLLTLLLSDLPAHRALGPAGAVGMAAALICALTFLPAALLLLGPAAFWPRRPRRGPGPAHGAGPWRWIASAVARGPRRIWACALAVIIAGAALSPLLTARGVPLDRALPPAAPSVTGQAALARGFPAGLGNPAVLLTDAAHAGEIRAAAADTRGVAAADVVEGRDGLPVTVAGRVQITATLTDPADSTAAQRTVVELRRATKAVPGASVLVGGQTAQTYDAQAGSAHDRRLIMPCVLITVLVVLVFLLRCLLTPLLLVVAVALNFLAALGICAALLYVVHGSADTEPTIVIYAFVFLVALGADYNIFLMHRVREEALRHGTVTGVGRGLASTGSVISSAGAVLAATFGALTVMPLVYLVHIGAIVAVGVLLDTLLVRLFLVPALVTDLAATAWWPGMLPADAATALHRLIGPRGAPPAQQEPVGS